MKCPLQRDPQAPVRTRQFIDQVHDILCSLITSGQLQLTGPNEWTLAPYLPLRITEAGDFRVTEDGSSRIWR